MKKNWAMLVVGVAIGLGGEVAAGELAHREASLKVIANTFDKDAKSPYQGQAYGVSAQRSEWGLESLAMPFTPAEDGQVRKIVVALGVSFGATTMNVSLQEDADGFPGATLGQFKLADVPPLGSCCETEAVRVKSVPVVAGKRYWVVAKASGDTAGGWHLNSIGATGDFVFRNKDGWHPESGVLAAFKVVGE